MPSASEDDAAPFLAPLNTHVWIFEHVTPHARSPTYVLVERGRTDPFERLGSARDLFAPRQRCDPRLVFKYRVHQLVPREFAPNRDYEVRAVEISRSEFAPNGGEERVVARFRTGETQDREPPRLTGELSCQVHDGRPSNEAACSLGLPGLKLALAVTDNATPTEMLRYTVALVGHEPGRAWVRESLPLLAKQGTQLTLGGDELCRGCLLELPEPLEPARVEVIVYDLAGNASEAASCSIVGPLSEEGSRLLQRRSAFESRRSPSASPWTGADPDSGRVGRSERWLAT